MLLSEFMSCARVLNGALRLNPWDTPAVAQAMYRALQMELAERTARRAALTRAAVLTQTQPFAWRSSDRDGVIARRERDLEFIRTHTASTWAIRFSTACAPNRASA